MKTKIITLKKVITKDIGLLLGLFFFSFFSPFIGVQAVAGPLVNATLFLAVFFLGVKNALWFAFFPSLVALFSGIISPLMVPLIPFIISSNIILIFIFNYFKDNFYLGVVLASFCKFLFLSISAYIISNLFLSSKVSVKISTIFGWQQLLTALLGGFIAYLIIVFIKNLEQQSK